MRVMRPWRNTSLPGGLLPLGMLTRSGSLISSTRQWRREVSVSSMRLTFVSRQDLQRAHWLTSEGLIYSRAIRQRCHVGTTNVHLSNVSVASLTVYHV